MYRVGHAEGGFLAAMLTFVVFYAERTYGV